MGLMKGLDLSGNDFFTVFDKDFIMRMQEELCISLRIQLQTTSKKQRKKPKDAKKVYTTIRLP